MDKFILTKISLLLLIFSISGCGIMQPEKQDLKATQVVDAAVNQIVALTQEAFEIEKTQEAVVQEQNALSTQNAIETPYEAPTAVLDDVDQQETYIQMAKDAFEFYFDLDMSEFTEQAEPISSNDDTEETSIKYFVEFKNNNDEMRCFAFFDDDILLNIYVVGGLGTIKESTEEKQKEAAIDFMVEKGLVASKEEAVFVDYFPTYLRGSGYIYADDQGNEIILGISDRSCRVELLMMDSGIK